MLEFRSMIFSNCSGLIQRFVNLRKYKLVSQNANSERKLVQYFKFRP